MLIINRFVRLDDKIKIIIIQTNEEKPGSGALDLAILFMII